MADFTPLTRAEHISYKRYRAALADRTSIFALPPAYVVEQLAPVRLRLERAIDDAYRVRDDAWIQVRIQASEAHRARRIILSSPSPASVAAARLRWVAARKRLGASLLGYAACDRLVRQRLRDYAQHFELRHVPRRRLWHVLVRASARLILRARRAQCSLRQRANWTLVERHRHAALESSIIRERIRLAIYLAALDLRVGRARRSGARAAE
ncbi:MAG: hypothetical protein AB7G15_17405 [Alphaproteobacteria bacterium]